MAAIEKGGRSVCRECAPKLKGQEFPLREPTREPLYREPWYVTVDLDMVEHYPKP